MTTRSSRKRKRISSPDAVQEPDGVGNGDAEEQDAKDTDPVWESFKEEYGEFFEQLPLSLHRTFALLYELDKQAQDTEAAVLPAVRKYSRDRLSLARTESSVALKNTDENHPLMNVDIKGRSSSITTNTTTRAKPPNTILPHVSTLLYELVHAAEEKANLAKSAYDTVDRHVRLLDQSIKEQEARLGIGPRPAGLFMPAIPGRRGGQANTDDALPSTINLDDQGFHEQEAPSLRPPGRVNRTNRSARPIKGPPRTLHDPPGPTEHKRREELVGIGGGLPIDPHEPRYCYCNEVSWGEMIACDAADCEKEWFHLGCVGMTEAPRGNNKWFCTGCEEKQGKGNSRKKS
ncbi:hypothetical protein SCHPADRAFT_902859 [Schizopora paradoxa]|uniref:Chromatin modification-related protein n=1 Tax=Schizopora paradoxa TaxID=27342 RepID=A0A0H2SD24_9AGAM|nr:hypothetical protein SCHPADRAFT_902859 [Schizopora paradoxa]